jgi:hypothetical protein
VRNGVLDQPEAFVLVNGAELPARDGAGRELGAANGVGRVSAAPTAVSTISKRPTASLAMSLALIVSAPQGGSPSPFR